jgi:hypothetical protein
MKAVRGRRLTVWLAPLFVVGLFATPQAFASATAATTTRTRGFVSFATFRSGLNHATYASAADEGGVVASPTAFAQMRTYLQHLYSGVDVRTSFATDGSYFDCVTTATQPSVRALGIRRIAPTPAPMPGASATRSSAWTTNGTNARGAVESCPTGTIPMQRTTLDQMAKFTSVRAFLARGHAPRAAVDTSTYRYAHAYQFVKNLGGESTNSVWNPKVPTGAGGDDHSLSQQWMSGGSGAHLQTAEAGWTKDPGFSTKKPIFFVYFTADDYNTTGCYNLSCGAFVQTDNSVALGGAVKPCCSTATVDDHLTQYWFLTGGDWWLNVNGTYIGYYPTSVYNGGQMSKNATEVDFGGEVNASLTTAPWPPMGSGKFASAGAKKAAYQSGIQYITAKGKFHATALTPSATSTCYSIAYTAASGATGTHFFFGGPGGAEGVC